MMKSTEKNETQERIVFNLDTEDVEGEFEDSWET